MLRALLLGVLSVTAIASCKGKDGGPTVQAGVAAGKVVELTGTVTATRGGQTRALAVGSEVSGDDEVATGTDGAVSIVLAHNNATWQLTANKHEKVADSLAWGLAKVATPAGGAIESTSAAGRHAERSAANSTTTVAPSAAPEAEEPPAMERKQATAAPSTASPQRGDRRASNAKGGEGGGGVEKAKAIAPPAQIAPSAQPIAPPARSGAAPGGPAPSPAPVAVPPPPPPPPPPSREETARAPLPAKLADAPAAEDKPDPAAELHVLATREREHMQACVDASTTTLSVTLVVSKGTAKLQVPAGTSPAITACLAKVAAAMKPSAAASGQLSIKLK